MKRLFYFTGYRLTVQHWKGKQLQSSTSFEPTETGLAMFRTYLKQTDRITSKFLVDVIEEDFRNETIPHVGIKDRNSVISRLTDRFYRASRDYSYSEVISREKEGRKDDVVLIGAITNPQLIQPWLSIIDECEVPLSGIWTLPLISRTLLKTIKASAGVVMLVSQQVNSNVRQSLFRDGKLISSRQSIINQDINDISGIGELALPEVNRTIEFFRVQGLIAEKESISLHIIGSDEQLKSLTTSFKDKQGQKVTIHSIADVQDKLGLKDVGRKFSDGIFSWLCVRQNLVASHYGESSAFMRYNNRLAATALYLASLLVLVFGVLITEANVSDAMEYEKSISLLKQEEQTYKELYSKKFEAFEAVFENVGVMTAAVDLAAQIKHNSLTSPLYFLISLSEILTKNNLSDIQIDRIEWKAISINEKKTRTQVQSKTANFTGKIEVKHDATVSGRIDVPENNYRASVDSVQKIIDYLLADPRVESVEAIKVPVDLRPESKFATESGSNIKDSANKETDGVFILHIIMQVPNHA